jgi:hypothetical protein
VTQQLIHRPSFHGIPGQIAVLGIPLQQPFPLQKTANAVGDGVGQLSEFLAGRRFDPPESGGCPVDTVYVNAIQEQQQF